MKQEENDENKKEEIISTESVTKDSNLKSIAGFSEALETPTKHKKKIVFISNSIFNSFNYRINSIYSYLYYPKRFIR